MRPVSWCQSQLFENFYEFTRGWSVFECENLAGAAERERSRHACPQAAVLSLSKGGEAALSAPVA